MPIPYRTTFKTKVKNYFKKLGYNPNNTSEDPNTPSGIGNLAARVLLESREEDASNQKNAYADWTGYKPVNAPPPEIPICLDRWQPMINRDSKPQEFMTPHWGKVIPFALKTGSQFRPKAPIKEGGKGFKEQGDCLTEISANLTDKQKIIAEFWAGMHEDLFEHFPARDKYDHWVTPPVQCCRIGGEIVVQRQLKGVPTVIFFFVLSNALMDAGIAAWDSKSHYDYCRPSSLIWRMRDDEKFPSWGGPGRGTVQMEGEGWIDDDSGNYINNPPFAEYVSGHSTFSHAKAEIVNCFFGDNSCESSVCIPAGGSKIEGKCDPPLPLKEVVLSWKTVDEMAAQAGMSRQYGGIHFEQGDHEGRELGRKVARCVWDIACEYLNGKVPK